MDRKEYRVVGIYDTETTTIGDEAFPYLFIFNWLKDPIDKYESPKSDDIIFLRTPEEMIDLIDDVMMDADGYVPVIAVYNLAFDIQPIMWLMNNKWIIEPLAASSTNFYYIDVSDGYKTVRFWDTSHLEPRGLWAMGEIAGLEKAIGDLDYSLIRTPETTLTEQELFYCRRDVQVIPAYLRYILESDDNINPNDFGASLLTQTSLDRIEMKRGVGQIKRGHTTLLRDNHFMCAKQRPIDFDQYAMRKCANRGGWTFTAANNASMIWENVVSVDACSMHHHAINGSYCPSDFQFMNKSILQQKINIVLNTDLEGLLASYDAPFEKNAFHMLVRIKNIRLKGVFEETGIGLLMQSKFRDDGVIYEISADDEPRIRTDRVVARAGFHDKFYGNTTFAYGKLMASDMIDVFVSELELWCINQVYEFDSIEALSGEVATKKNQVPPLISMMSNVLYEQKNAMKQILKYYQEGKPYTKEISELLPKSIQKGVKRGTISTAFLESFYMTGPKAKLNAIYGTQVQDEYKCSWTQDENGEFIIDEETLPSVEDFQPKKYSNVNYPFGLRIVGKSRMHLCIAMLLLDRRFGDRIHILGGDTDSMKIATDIDVTDEELIEALKPLHDAVDRSIDRQQSIRIRKDYKQYASDLDNIGHYEVETYAGGKYSRYKQHMELWNKCRVSLDMEDKVHLTLAGISQPDGAYNIPDAIEDAMRSGLSFEEAAKLFVGYNVTYRSSISHMLGHKRPRFEDRFERDVVDYLGKKTRVNTYKSIALYPQDKTIGSVSYTLNGIFDLAWQERKGNHCHINPRFVWVDEDNVYVGVINDNPTREDDSKLYKFRRGK